MPPQKEALQFIAEIYDLVAAPEKWPEVIDRFAHHLNAAAALLQVVDHECGENNFMAASRIFANPGMRQALEEYLQHIWQQESLLYERVAQPSGTNFLLDYQCLGYGSPEQLRNHPPTQWLRRNMGFYYRMAASLSVAPGNLRILSVQYPARRRKPLSAAELDFANYCRPHFARVLELSHQFDRLRLGNQAMLQALDRQLLPTFVLDERRRLLYANQSGQALLQQSPCGVFLDAAGRLRAHYEDKQLEQAMRGATRTASGEGSQAEITLSLSAEQGRDACLASISPLRDPHGELQIGLRGILLTVIDPQNLPPVSVACLARYAGLSPAETEVCQLLCEGSSAPDIARIRDVSTETVRTQIKKILQKTNATDRMQLLRKVLRLQLPSPS